MTYKSLPTSLGGVAEINPNGTVVVVDSSDAAAALRGVTSWSVVCCDGEPANFDWSPLVHRVVVVWVRYPGPKTQLVAGADICAALNGVAGTVRRMDFCKWKGDPLPVSWSAADAVERFKTKDQLVKFLLQLAPKLPETSASSSEVPIGSTATDGPSMDSRGAPDRCAAIADASEDARQDRRLSAVRRPEQVASVAPDVDGDLGSSNVAGKLETYVGGLEGVEAKVDEFDKMFAELAVDTVASGGKAPFLILDGEGKPKRDSTGNMALLLEHSRATEGMLALNLFSGEPMLVKRPPWEWRRSGPFSERPISDGDAFEAHIWLEQCGMKPRQPQVMGLLDGVAARRRYNPVLSYFKSLPIWDGVCRVDGFLVHYLGAVDTRLNRAFGRKFLAAIVKRALKPGCKLDTALVLQGEQGLKKSTFGRALVPYDYLFSDDVEVGEASREVIELTRGKLIVEMSELSSKSNKEIDAVKRFMSKQSDKARGAFKRKVEDVQRGFVFYGSTNRGQFLVDTTGNRRWWPVEVRMIDTSAIAHDRDQIWAEVRERFSNERIWIDRELDADLWNDLEALNKDKTDYGPLFDVFYDKVPEGPMIVPVADIRRLVTGADDDAGKFSGRVSSDMSRALAGLGFNPTAIQIRGSGGASAKHYVRGDIALKPWAEYDISTRSIVFKRKGLKAVGR